MERLRQEIKRRTYAIGIFPNPAARLRLISTFLMENSEAWMISPKYLILMVSTKGCYRLRHSKYGQE